jgi:hypothetical protein
VGKPGQSGFGTAPNTEIGIDCVANADCRPAPLDCIETNFQGEFQETGRHWQPSMTSVAMSRHSFHDCGHFEQLLWPTVATDIDAHG